MARKSSPDRLNSPEVLTRHLKSLLRRDPRLRAIAKRAGAFEVRLSARGFPGMARVVTGQQLSVASARAIWSRVEAIPGATDPKRLLRLKDDTLRAAGLSAGKIRTLRTIAQAVVDGSLDFDLVEQMTPEEATTYLTAHKGIGPWTAEIYLMFCAGHPDIFPAGDLALRKAVRHALELAELPSTDELIEIAKPWSPHRHAAALLFWRYYGEVVRKTEGIAL
jgi:DNA-3-methyladenine glycosylase II